MFRILLALLLILAPTQSWAITQWTKSSLPVTGDNLTSWPTQVNAQWSILDTLFSNYRRGYNLTYSSASTLVASAGEITVSNSGGTARLFLQNAGSSNITFSNIDTGAEAPGTYYVYCGTSTATDAACTFYVSLSSSAPTGVTYYARLGYFTNDGSSNITANSIINDNYTQSYIFGDWSSKSTSTIYQAATDGIVMAWYSSSNNNVSLTVLTDSSSSPSTTRAKTSDQSGTNSGFVMTPVRKNDYYQVTYYAPSAASVTVYWLPIGN